MQLVGREPDLAAMLERARLAARGQGQAVLLHGEPGVGKTALLDELGGRLSAEGWGVMRCTGVSTEHHVPLTALHELLGPVLARSVRLSEPQLAALETAFGLREGEVEFFPLALATLAVLSRLAQQAPLAVLVDDAHWLDGASSEVLAFVARRTSPAPVFLVLSARPARATGLVKAGVPVVELRPLEPRNAEALLDTVAPDVTRERRTFLLEAAAGNPLGLIELPKVRSNLEPQTGPDPLTLTARLSSAFAERAGELPTRTWELLLLLALNDTPALGEALRASQHFCGHRGVEDLDPAVEAGLVAPDGPLVRFRHPLVRSALAQSGTEAERRAAHTALALALEAHPDRRAWHRAHAATGPDAEIATNLEGTADQALRRGSASGAVEALRRAAELSDTPAATARRLLRAASLALDAGDSGLAQRLLQQAHPLARSDPERLEYELVLEQSDELMRGGAARVQVLVDLADLAAGNGDIERALRLLTRAATRCWHLDLGTEVEQGVLMALARLHVADDDSRHLAIRAYTSPLAHGPDIARTLAERPVHFDDDPAELVLLGHSAACVGAFREAEDLCARAATVLRERGRLAPLTHALSLQAWAALRRGRLHIAETAARECVDLACDIGQPIPEAAALAALAGVEGLRGHAEVAEALASRAERLAADGGNTIGLAVTQVARALVALSAGLPEEAYEQLRPVCSRSGRAYQRMQAVWAAGSFAEAAAQAGHAGEARSELEHWLSEVPKGAPLGVHLTLRYASAVLADPATAERSYRSALAADWSDWTLEHGRLLLAYGSWLRRGKRVTEARVHLRAARDVFRSIGSAPWLDRAHGELRAAGEIDQALHLPPLALLTPQELQIARLVLEGLSNKEIGQRLHLAPRTVGGHLYRMFPKLGVASRAQLARLLAPALTTEVVPSRETLEQPGVPLLRRVT